MQDDAILTLRQYRFDENPAVFVKKVHDALQDLTKEEAFTK